MKRLITVLTILALTLAGGSLVWAQNPDPLHIGQFNAPAALEGGYQTGAGLFQFLIIGAPQECLDGSKNCPDTTAHLWFYTAACTRVENGQVKLSKKKVSVIPLHDGLVTSNRVGNVLVAGTPPGLAFDKPRLTTSAIIGQTWFIDANRGIGRIEDMARLAGNDGEGWQPYRPAHVLLFAPPDDGVGLFDTLIFRCPQGTARQKAGTAGGVVVGTPLTLGGDMLDLASQSTHGSIAGAALDANTTVSDSSDLCNDCATNGTFAKVLTAIVRDDNEGFLKSIDSITCRCLGASIAGGAFSNEVRLRDMAIQAGSQNTYWEITTVGAPDGNELFTAALNVQVKSTVNVNFYTRLWSANDPDNLEP